MALTKTNMLVALPPSPHRTTSSFAATKIRVAGRRCSRGGVHAVASLGPSLQHTVSPKISSDSWNYDDDHEFLDRLSSWSCIGSSHGWLGYIDPSNLSFYLFKPSLVNDPCHLPYIILPPIQFASDISKMVFSSCPKPTNRRTPFHNLKNHLVLVVITLDWLGPPAAFCRIGDPHWTILANFPEESCSNNIQDIIYYRKQKLFYVVTDSGKIYSWNLSHYQWFPMTQQLKCRFRYLADHQSHSPESVKENGSCKYYLVVDKSRKSLIVICLHFVYDKVSRKDKVNTHNIDRLHLLRHQWSRLPDSGETLRLLVKLMGSL